MRKATKRKVWPLLNPITMAMQGVKRADTASLDKLRLMELSCLDSLTKGVGTVSDWSAMSNVLNIAEALCFFGVGKDEVFPVCQKAQSALLDAAKRYEATGKVGFDGLGLQALRELLELHDLQRTSIDRSTYERAIERAGNLIKSKHSTVLEIV